MSDRTPTTNQESRFFEALTRATHMPDSAEGVALEMTRMILAASTRVPTSDEFLDLYTECLRAVLQKRTTGNYSLH